jgi:hypothetical protein
MCATNRNVDQTRVQEEEHNDRPTAVGAGTATGGATGTEKETAKAIANFKCTVVKRYDNNLMSGQVE